MAAPYHQCPQCGMKARTLPGLAGHIRFRHSEEFKKIDQKRNDVALSINIAVASGKLEPIAALELAKAISKNCSLALLEAVEMSLLKLMERN